MAAVELSEASEFLTTNGYETSAMIIEQEKPTSCLAESQPFGPSTADRNWHKEQGMVEEEIRCLTPRPAAFRYTAIDSLPDISKGTQVDGRASLLMPDMYVTSSGAHYQKKRRLLRDIGVQITDEDFESHGYLPNVVRGPYQNMGREVYQDKRRKRATIKPKKKIYQDAAHSCAVEIDDGGCLQTVILTDDLGQTKLRFGRQNILFELPVQIEDVAPYAMRNKKCGKKFVGRKYHKATNQTTEPYGNIGLLPNKESPGYEDRNRTISIPCPDMDTYAMKTTDKFRTSTPQHLSGTIPVVSMGEIESEMLPRLMVNVGTQVSIMPEEETEEYFQIVGRRPYHTHEPSSSEDDEESGLEVDFSEKEKTADPQWRFELEEVGKASKIMIRGSRKDVERLKRLDSRLMYGGEEQEYRLRRSTIENKAYYIPDDMKLFVE